MEKEAESFEERTRRLTRIRVQRHRDLRKAEAMDLARKELEEKMKPKEEPAVEG